MSTSELSLYRIESFLSCCLSGFRIGSVSGYAICFSSSSCYVLFTRFVSGSFCFECSISSFSRRCFFACRRGGCVPSSSCILPRSHCFSSLEFSGSSSRCCICSCCICESDVSSCCVFCDSRFFPGASCVVQGTSTKRVEIGSRRSYGSRSRRSRSWGGSRSPRQCSSPCRSVTQFLVDCGRVGFFSNPSGRSRGS